MPSSWSEPVSLTVGPKTNVKIANALVVAIIRNLGPGDVTVSGFGIVKAGHFAVTRQSPLDLLGGVQASDITAYFAAP
jgi:hypothetical protein